MTYTDALSRVQELQTRLGLLSGAGSRMYQSRNFDTVLATAQNRFDDGPRRLPQNGDYSRQAAASLAGIGGAGTQVAAASMGPSARTMRAPGLTPELRGMFDRISTKHKVPAALVMAVARAESGFRADVTSHAGAQGMMQLMPATGKGLGVTDPFDAEQSIEGGTRYLRNALKMFDGDIRLAAVAYNAGPYAVKRHGGIPPYEETRNYVTKVVKYAREFGLEVR